MSENSKKAARVNSLKKKLQVRRAARGPAGGRINTDELRMLIGRLKYGKAAGIDAITTDLLKVCADNSALLRKLRICSIVF